MASTEDLRDYHTINDDSNKAIIQTLADSSGDVEASTVILCYTVGSSSKDIRKQLKSQLMPPLKKAATYLQLNTEGVLKEDLITSILRRIETLLMDLCGICGEYYSNSLHDAQSFNCLICNQGCHQPCYKEMQSVFDGMPETMKHAFQFICTKCYGDFSDDHSAAQKSKQSPVKEVNVTKQNEGDTEAGAGLVDTTEGTTDGTPEGNSSNITALNHHNADTDDQHNETSEDIPAVAICPAYKWGRCYNYESCEYRHPPRCWNWLSHGKCSYKKKCRYHHPPLCRNSLRERKCFNEGCKFFHVSKTLRRNAEDEQLKSSLHAPNYQAQHNQPQHHQSQVTVPPQPPPSHPPRPLLNYQTRPPYQPAAQVQHQPINRQDSRSNFSASDISFLAKTIKDLLSNDIGKEISEIKQRLNNQIPSKSVPQVISAETQPQPHLYSLQMIPRPQ